MIVLRDAGDPSPYTFQGYDCVVSIRELPCGDYSLFGFEQEIAILRRSGEELITSLTARRDDFTAQLERIRNCRSVALVVDNTNLRDFLEGKHPGFDFNRDVIEQSLISITARYRLPIHFAGNRAEAERYAYNFLRHLQVEAVRKYNAVARSVNTHAEMELDEVGKSILAEQTDARIAAERKAKAQAMVNAQTGMEKVERLDAETAAKYQTAKQGVSVSYLEQTRPAPILGSDLLSAQEQVAKMTGRQARQG